MVLERSLCQNFGGTLKADRADSCVQPGLQMHLNRPNYPMLLPKDASAAYPALNPTTALAAAPEVDIIIFPAPAPEDFKRATAGSTKGAWGGQKRRARTS